MKLAANIAVDITKGKHHGNEQSEQAHRRVMSSKENQRNEVLDLIRSHGGLTMKEVATMLGKSFNAVSGRGSELKALGKVYATTEVRDGSAVLSAMPLSVEELMDILG